MMIWTMWRVDIEMVDGEIQQNSRKTWNDILKREAFLEQRSPTAQSMHTVAFKAGPNACKARPAGRRDSQGKTRLERRWWTRYRPLAATTISLSDSRG